MRQARRSCWVVVALVAAVLLLGSTWGFAVKYQTIEGIAMGQETQLGRHANVTIIIYEYSTEEDQKNLLGAFQASGMHGLYDAICKMKAHGHIAITGTLGYDLNYIKLFETPEGRKIRAVTDRPIRFGEAWNDTRSMDYALSAFEIVLSPEKGKSGGMLFPAMELKVNPANNQIEVESFKFPWKLMDLRESMPKDKD